MKRTCMLCKKEHSDNIADCYLPLNDYNSEWGIYTATPTRVGMCRKCCGKMAEMFEEEFNLAVVDMELKTDFNGEF